MDGLCGVPHESNENDASRLRMGRILCRRWLDMSVLNIEELEAPTAWQNIGYFGVHLGVSSRGLFKITG